MGWRSLNGELAESFMGHSSSLSSYLAREGIYTRGLGTLRRIGSNQDLKLHPVHLLHGTFTNSPIIPKAQIRKSSFKIQHHPPMKFAVNRNSMGDWKTKNFYNYQCKRKSKTGAQEKMPKNDLLDALGDAMTTILTLILTTILSP